MTGSFAAGPAVAQSDGSFAVVQPLPPAGVSELNDALQRLARNSADVGALVDAGNASIKVNDIDAAIGFFGRAEELAPGNARVKIGLAAAYVRKQRPLDALSLFDAAEAAGASAGTLSGDRGLAYDLVGDNVSAQGQYQQALGLQEDNETRRRLALSYAMQGNKAAFEKTLSPLIVQQDFPSYRTRAFGLAILGDEAEAIAIAEAVMPQTMAARIAPYLRYMPRLTKAQQAAAANLGIFPRAAQIGRDAPQIAQYSGNASTARGADARLEPQGEPLGRRDDATSQRRRPDRGRSKVEPTPVEVAIAEPKAPAMPPASAVVRASEVVKPEQSPIIKSAGAESQISLPVVQPTVTALAPPSAVPVQTASTATSVNSKTVLAETTLPPVTTPSATSIFDLAQVKGQTEATNAAAPKPALPPAEEPASVADAFANFSLKPTTGPEVQPGVVDILSIKPPREVARPVVQKPAAEPKKPVIPKRYWVQVATGRDKSALKFDWRRISRTAGEALTGKSPFTATWGQTNRLLTGPYNGLRDAQTAVAALKKTDIDSFTFTSAEGEEVEPLK
ncbi:MAG: SPOR domain-containing protein [Pontixanthobacter sp.]